MSVGLRVIDVVVVVAAIVVLGSGLLVARIAAAHPAAARAARVARVRFRVLRVGRERQLVAQVHVLAAQQLVLGRKPLDFDSRRRVLSRGTVSPRLL